MYYKIFSLSFKKVKAVNNEIDIRLLFKEKMCPALLNIRSQAAELVWTPRYFLANLAKPGKWLSHFAQNTSGQSTSSSVDTIRIYSSMRSPFFPLSHSDKIPRIFRI